MKPFLKWAGNKIAIIERIRRLLPEKNRLIEPFTGSAALFLNTGYSSALLGDNNADLIHLYKTLQSEGDVFIAYAARLFTDNYNSEEAYYALREEFNTTRNLRRKAALFLYLNRHGYNGLCRYNSHGGFNVPFGRYVKPYFPSREMHAFHAKSRAAEFRAADFRAVMNEARAGDVVYCDPPYVPLSATANFTSYGGGAFGINEHGELAHLAKSLAARGVTVVISNHETAYTVDAYRSACITRLDVRRSISCKGSSRTPAKELLALFVAAS